MLYWFIWFGFIAYAAFLAPPDRPETLSLIQNLSTGQWNGINPLIVALFNLMGIWPLIYSAVLYADGRGQRVRAFPFAAGSFAVGAFALLPYLALRKPNPTFIGETSWLIRILDSVWTGRVLLLGAIALLVYGFTQGNWADFVQQWQTSKFIHVMSLDFVALSALFPVLLRDDLARRGLGSRWFWAIALVPLLGPLVYLSVRPPLARATEFATSEAAPETDPEVSLEG
ncbi:DUF2834 domain-containing protein [Thermoleptolyngbya oregonensis NK1-22]|uniref:DUF2834 domain-containing protein n=1 Tax=Thermoleptolyngbya oregonensis NK1-22 TaxID=2547457 RepID=A0AA96Y8C2_9CYAN|nr:DUF2834 domain-containing protein [Thermoleptolyngbya oregonensis NK1-22]